MSHMNSIDILLKIIVTQYFLNSKCIFFIDDGHSAPVNLPLGFSTVAIKVDLSDNVSTISEKLFQNYGCQMFIFNVQRPEFVLSIVEQGLKNQNETFTRRRYIFIDNGSDGVDGFATELFKTREINFISNLLIISLEKLTASKTSKIHYGDELYGLWTQRYAGANSTLELVLLDKWSSLNEDFLNNINLFPDKMVANFGRIYRIGFFPYIPYIFYRLNMKHEIILDGMEGIIVNEFFKKHNLSMRPFLVEKDYWGDVFDNGSVYGLRGLVYEDKVDMGVANNFATDRMYRYYGWTVLMHRIGITCLVPAPRLKAGWFTPLNVYSKLLWRMIFMAYIFIILSIYFAQFASQFKTFTDLRTNKYVTQIKKLGEILFTVFTQDFGANSIFKGYSGTIFVIVIVFVTFFLSKSYESGLASIMTIPRYENSIETSHDFFNSNISWGGIQLADWIKHWETDEDPKYKRAYRRYIAASSEAQLKQLLAAGSFGLLIERLPGDHFHLPFESLETSKYIRLMREDIHREYSVFLMRKSSPLIPLLDRFLFSVNEAGINHYWLNQAAAKVLPQTAQKEMKYQSLHYSPPNQLVHLRLAHVAGVFGIVAIGNLIACFIFFAELIQKSR